MGQPNAEGKTGQGLKSARIEIRTRQDVKEAISEAAMLSGIDLSSFMVGVAYRAARDVIEAHRLTVLTDPAERKAFMDALKNPAAPSEALRQALSTDPDRSGDGE